MIVTIWATPLSWLQMSENKIRVERQVRHRSRPAKPCPVTMRRVVLSVFVTFAGFIAGAAEPGEDLSRPSPLVRGAKGRRNGLASAAGIEFNYVHADLEFEGQNFKDVAVRYKGNGTFMQSRGSLKRSLKVALNKFAKGQKLAGISKLNFHNNVTDASWMNEVLSHRLFRVAGVPGSSTALSRA